MPTYRNDATTSVYIVKDIYDKTQKVNPGESIETYEDLSGNADFTETDTSPSNTVTITGQNIWTDGVPVRDKDLANPLMLNLSISGVVDSLVTLQRSDDGGAVYRDVQNFNADQEAYIVDAAENTVYRVGIATGDYGTDTVIVKLGK